MTHEVRTEEECWDHFWNVVAKLTIKYADQLSERQAAATASGGASHIG
ncbi:hypothetical protein V7793_05155 [Streptomyces sp. KLMMK]